MRSPKAFSYIYLYLSGCPRPGVKAVASGACSRQTPLRRPLDHASISPSIEATSLIDLDHWRSVIARAGQVPGGWPDYSSWLAIQSKRPFDCLCNNELIVTQSTRGIGTEIESSLLSLTSQNQCSWSMYLGYLPFGSYSWLRQMRH